MTDERGSSDREVDTARRAGRIAAFVLGTALCRYVLRLPPMADWDGPVLARELGQVLQGFIDQDPSPAESAGTD